MCSMEDKIYLVIFLYGFVLLWLQIVVLFVALIILLLPAAIFVYMKTNYVLAKGQSECMDLLY